MCKCDDNSSSWCPCPLVNIFDIIDEWMKQSMVEDDCLKILSIDEFGACSYEWLKGV